jgi:NAD(P)-dependent dehydrogenase (short-subunit alcohol dehydrogenase family)
MKRAEVVVITGGSAGVGRATAREFAERGARIGLLSRGTQGLEGATNEIERLGGRALAVPTDVSDPQAVEEAAERVEGEFGPIDVWINNAMETVLAPFLRMTAQEFKRVTEVTYLGQVYGTMAALKRMVPRDRGVIVQVGSALAYRSIPLQSAYCGAKHAIRGFTDSIRSELLHDRSKVKITMVQLPAVNTPQFDWARTKMPKEPQPVPPIFQPEVTARAIFYAAHHPRREIFVGLPTVITIWGNKFFPRIGDWYLGKTGYGSQQHDGAPASDRPDYLFRPVEKDYGAHGDFDSRAHSHSPALWISMHRAWSAAIAALSGLALAAAIGNGRRKRSS